MWPSITQGGKLPVSNPPFWINPLSQGVGVGVGVGVSVGVGLGVGEAVGVGVGVPCGGTWGSVKASPLALMRESNHMPRTRPLRAPRP